MRVVVAGSSGLIGTALVADLRRRDTTSSGWFGVPRPRRTSAAGTRRPARIDAGTFEGVDAVVGLGGVPIARPAVERGPQAADPRQPQRADRGARRRGRRARRPDLRVRVGGWATTATPATASTDETARRAPGSSPRCAATGRPPPSGPSTRARGWCACAPGRCSPRRGGLLGVLRPLFSWRSAGGSATGRSTCRGSRSTTRSAASGTRWNTTASPARSTCAPEPRDQRASSPALAEALHRPAPWFAPAIALRSAVGDGAERDPVQPADGAHGAGRPGVRLPLSGRSRTRLVAALRAVLVDSPTRTA